MSGDFHPHSCSRVVSFVLLLHVEFIWSENHVSQEWLKFPVPFFSYFGLRFLYYEMLNGEECFHLTCIVVLEYILMGSNIPMLVSPECTLVFWG